jgi:peptidoglycan/LPS O-acetylase OafA/YrhL
MLRKGPEQVPDSWLVLLITLVLMQFASFIAATLINLGEDYSHLLTFITHLLGMGIYAAILLATGFIRRIVPVLSAIIACGAILTLLFVAAYVMLNPFLGSNIAVIIATLIIIWSVPVEGHIIARGIEQHWYIGIVIAMIVFTVQYAFQSTMTGRI